MDNVIKDTKRTYFSLLQPIDWFNIAAMGILLAVLAVITFLDIPYEIRSLAGALMAIIGLVNIIAFLRKSPTISGKKIRIAGLILFIGYVWIGTVAFLQLWDIHLWPM